MEKEFRVNTQTYGAQKNPSIAMLKDGSFVVVWENRGYDAPNGTPESCAYWARFDSNGTLLAGPTRSSSIDKDGTFRKFVFVSSTDSLGTGFDVSEPTTGATSYGTGQPYFVGWRYSRISSSGASEDRTRLIYDQIIKLGLDNNYQYEHVMTSIAPGMPGTNCTLLAHELSKRLDVNVIGKNSLFWVMDCGNSVKAGSVFKEGAHYLKTSSHAVVAVDANTIYFAWINVDDGIWVKQITPASGAISNKKLIQRDIVFTDREGTRWPLVLLRLSNGEIVLIWKGVDNFCPLINIHSFARDNIVSTIRLAPAGQRCDGSSIGSISAAALDDGEFVVVWSENQANGKIFGQRFFNHFEEKDGTKFLINEKNTVDVEHDLVVTALKSSGFAVTWSGGQGNGKDIYARVFTVSLDAVNKELIGSQKNPSIATLNDGSFVVVWEDRGPSGPFTYWTRFDSDGTTLAGPTRSSSIDEDGAFRKFVSVSSTDSLGTGFDLSEPSLDFTHYPAAPYFVGWHYTQVSSTGIVIDRTRLVYNKIRDLGIDPYQYEHVMTSIAPDIPGTGCTLLAHELSKRLDVNVIGKNSLFWIEDCNGNIKVGSVFQEGAHYSKTKAHAVVAAGSGVMIIAWINVDDGIWVKQITTASGTISDKKLIQRDIIFTDAENTRWPLVLLRLKTNELLLIWKGVDNFCPIINIHSLSRNSIVNTIRLVPAGQRCDGSNIGSISATALNDGAFVVVWDQFANEVGSIFGQKFFGDMSPNGEMFRISENDELNHSNPVVTGIGLDGFAVAWHGYSGITAEDIYKKIFASSFTPNSEIRLNPQTFGAQTNPSIAALKDGSFVAVWEDVRTLTSTTVFRDLNIQCTPTSNAPNVIQCDCYIFSRLFWVKEDPFGGTTLTSAQLNSDLIVRKTSREFVFYNTKLTKCSIIVDVEQILPPISLQDTLSAQIIDSNGNMNAGFNYASPHTRGTGSIYDSADFLLIDKSRGGEVVYMQDVTKLYLSPRYPIADQSCLTTRNPIVLSTSRDTFFNTFVFSIWSGRYDFSTESSVGPMSLVNPIFLLSKDEGAPHPNQSMRLDMLQAHKGRDFEQCKHIVYLDHAAALTEAKNLVVVYSAECISDQSNRLARSGLYISIGRVPASRINREQGFSSSTVLASASPAIIAFNHPSPLPPYDIQAFVAWTWNYNPKTQDDIWIKLIAVGQDSDLVAMREPTRANTYVLGSQMNPAVARLKDGSFVVVWESYGQDQDMKGIYAQKFSSAAGLALNTVGTEFRVNTYTVGDQKNPTIATLTSGDFIIAWDSQDQDGSVSGIFAQRFFPNATRSGQEFQVNINSFDAQTKPTITALDNDRYAIAWVGKDGSGEGIFARNFESRSYEVRDEILPIAQLNRYLEGQISSDSINSIAQNFTSLVRLRPATNTKTQFWSKLMLIHATHYLASYAHFQNGCYVLLTVSSPQTTTTTQASGTDVFASFYTPEHTQVGQAIKVGRFGRISKVRVVTFGDNSVLFAFSVLNAYRDNNEILLQYMSNTGVLASNLLRISPCYYGGFSIDSSKTTTSFTIAFLSKPNTLEVRSYGIDATMIFKTPKTTSASPAPVSPPSLVATMTPDKYFKITREMTYQKPSFKVRVASSDDSVTLVWSYNDYHGIFAQRYNAFGLRLGPRINIQSAPLYFIADSDQSGRYVIGWVQDHQTHRDTLFQVFSPNSTRLSQIITADERTTNQTFVRIYIQNSRSIEVNLLDSNFGLTTTSLSTSGARLGFVYLSYWNLTGHHYGPGPGDLRRSWFGKILVGIGTVMTVVGAVSCVATFGVGCAVAAAGLAVTGVGATEIALTDREDRKTNPGDSTHPPASLPNTPSIPPRGCVPLCEATAVCRAQNDPFQSTVCLPLTHIPPEYVRLGNLNSDIRLSMTSLSALGEVSTIRNANSAQYFIHTTFAQAKDIVKEIETALNAISANGVQISYTKSGDASCTPRPQDGSSLLKAGTNHLHVCLMENFSEAKPLTANLPDPDTDNVYFHVLRELIAHYVPLPNGHRYEFSSTRTREECARDALALHNNKQLIHIDCVGRYIMSSYLLNSHRSSTQQSANMVHIREGYGYTAARHDAAVAALNSVNRGLRSMLYLKDLITPPRDQRAAIKFFNAKREYQKYICQNLDSWQFFRANVVSKMSDALEHRLNLIYEEACFGFNGEIQIYTNNPCDSGVDKNCFNQEIVICPPYFDLPASTESLNPCNINGHPYPCPTQDTMLAHEIAHMSCKVQDMRPGKDITTILSLCEQYYSMLPGCVTTLPHSNCLEQTLHSMFLI